MKDEEMRPVHNREKTLFKDFMRCPFNVKLRIAVNPSSHNGYRKEYHEIFIVLHFGSVLKIEGAGTSCGRKTGR
ncbi:hypothetical protein CEXT_690341 [Caerostris extrusa]|uniref:LAGLIDADG homing endonuclease n=1 Tax=Caerostris extrusa TaxID=172846 RepID=A0AAV4SB21_CAEEX|nr:hypothetical protein CEXT_690341 [Caerostris extrusa]